MHELVIDRLTSDHIALKRGDIGTVIPVVGGKIDADLLRARVDAMTAIERSKEENSKRS